MATPTKIWRFTENKKTEQLCNGLLEGNNRSTDKMIQLVKDCTSIESETKVQFHVLDELFVMYDLGCAKLALALVKID